MRAGTAFARAGSPRTLLAATSADLARRQADRSRPDLGADPPGASRSAAEGPDTLLVGGGAHRSYERLEFLGDSVLGLAIASALYERYPAARRATWPG